MITPTTVATAATTPTEIPAIAPSVNPLLLVPPMEGVAVIVSEVVPTAVPAAVPVAVPVVVPVLATADGELLVLLDEVVPVLVENTDGVEPGIVVPIDPLGNTRYSFDAASIGFTPEFGEPNVLTQTLTWPERVVHVS